MLVRTADEHGFVFFTNYRSRKAREIEENPAGGLCFYWPWLDEQVRAEGRLEKVSPAESDRYFATRPRGSRIGAWASAQSEPLSNRSDLEKPRYFDVERQYQGAVVPRPPHWGGYRLTPDRIEFWKAGHVPSARPRRVHAHGPGVGDRDALPLRKGCGRRVRAEGAA